MPNLKAAKKALRQTKKRTAANRSYKNRIKNIGSEIAALLSAGKTNEAGEKLPNFYKAIDKATKRNILQKNTASRRKSLMARRFNQATTADANSSQAK